MSSAALMENLVEDLGGCGRYQWLISFIIHLAKTGVTWTMLTMTFAGQDPGFWCLSGAKNDNQSIDSDSNITGKDVCSFGNVSTCAGFRFDEQMKTIVSEYNLVCDSAWIIATITTIQMAGVLIGCFTSGHLGDLIGRKPTYYISILILALGNVAIVFSPSWQVHAACMCVLGIGIGFYFSVQYIVVLEFLTTKWRARMVATPSWPLEASLFALVAWAFKDWKYIHISSAVVLVPMFLTWPIIPESARWLLTKQKFTTFEYVINLVAKYNKTSVPDLTKITAVAKDEHQHKIEKQHYTVIDVFKGSLKLPSPSYLFGKHFKMSMSLAYYGITFGVKNLSGDLYLNLFLMNIIEAPIQISLMYFANRFGRQKTCLGAFMISGLCALAVGILVYVDTPAKGTLTNVFALIAKFTNGLGWSSMIVFTSELYPTVVRSIAYGLHNTSARIGSMIAPQIVFLNDSVDGLLFFLAGALMIISSLLCLILPETKDKELQDTFDSKTSTESEVEKEGQLQTKL